VDCGAGADRHGQRGQVRAPSSGSEPRPTQNRKRPRTLRPDRIPIYGWTPFIAAAAWQEPALRPRQPTTANNMTISLTDPFIKHFGDF
jgi:hypothetical protein